MPKVSVSVGRGRLNLSTNGIDSLHVSALDFVCLFFIKTPVFLFEPEAGLTLGAPGASRDRSTRRLQRTRPTHRKQQKYINLRYNSFTQHCGVLSTTCTALDFFKTCVCTTFHFIASCEKDNDFTRIALWAQRNNRVAGFGFGPQGKNVSRSQVKPLDRAKYTCIESSKHC